MSENNQEAIDILEEQFTKLPKEKLAAFATRLALRFLPSLCEPSPTRKIPFSIWTKAQRANNLIVFFRILNSSVMQALGRDKTDFDQILPQAQRVKARVNRSHQSGKDMSDADMACTAILLAGMTASYFPSYTKAAAMVSCIKPKFMGDLEKTEEVNDLEDARTPYGKQLATEIKLLHDESVSAEAFLQHPLWDCDPPEQWKSSCIEFEKGLSSLGNGFEIWRRWYSNFLQGNPLDDQLLNKIHDLPEEIIAQGAIATNAYIAARLRQTAIKPLNRVRVIFIGYGDSGKTSLIKVLHGEPVVEGREPMTPGIDIREWQVPDTEIKAHFWDFGGQVMVHATHQLFLRSSCLYVLVVNARAEISATEQAQYWLEHVRSFGGNAPVMVVGNRIDQADLNIDMGLLREKYQNIVGYYPLSCTQAQGRFASHANTFRDAFRREVLAISTHQVMFTEEQFEVLQELRQLTRKQSFLPKQEFDQICNSHGVSLDPVQGRRWLLDVLDKLGVIIHFPQLPFADGYVLNPRWLTYGVYKLMYGQKARIDINDIVRLLSDEKVIDEAGNELRYPSDKCRLIMDAMREFKLSYPLGDDEKTIIIPALLPAEQAVIKFDKSAGLSFEYSFDVFLPRHIFPQLIVGRHQEIFEECVWQTGVHFKSGVFDASALITADYHARKISIWVIGSNAKEYLAVLRDDLDAILQRIDVAYQEYVVLPENARLNLEQRMPLNIEKAPYRQVLAYASRGEFEYISISGNIYDIAIVLGNVVTTKRQKLDMINQIKVYGGVVNMGNSTGNKSINVANSAISGSIVAADDVANSFNLSAGSVELEKLKQLVEALQSRVNELKTSAPPDSAGDVLEISADTNVLVNEVSAEKPSESRIRRRIDGILSAAKSIGVAGLPVLEGAVAIKELLS
ncbi:COR domain-containing protein [Massilia sp. BHUDP2]|uniref:COR domain-containing protein n=1 Tax=Massilia sp. BHUDP2 TaxID=3034505 RepID=UPI003905F73C